MPYVPNPTDVTEPVETREVASAAREFREIKRGLTAEIFARTLGDRELNTRVSAVEKQNFTSTSPGAVAVNKEYIATANQTTFVLDFLPAVGSVVNVHVNGVYQHKTVYTVSGLNVIFDVGLAAGYVVEISVATPVAKRLLLGGDFDFGYLTDRQVFATFDLGTL